MERSANEQISTLIKRVRRCRGMTQAALADRLAGGSQLWIDNVGSASLHGQRCLGMVGDGDRRRSLRW